MYTLEAAAAAAAAKEGGAEPAPSILATTDLRCGGVAWCDGVQTRLLLLLLFVWDVGSMHAHL